MLFEVNKIRQDFPILKTQIYGKNLVYFDNAATTQKPQIVIDSCVNFYQTQNASTHSFHFLSNNLTNQIEEVRLKVKNFVNAKEVREIIFCKGATEGLNLLANGLENQLQKNDEVLITQMEHHANIIPWQILAKKTGAKLKYIKLKPTGELDLLDFEKKLNSRTKILAITHISNVLGLINPLKQIIKKARQNGTLVVVDGTQAAAHLKIDVQNLDVDFYVFSGHKMYAPTGIGVIFGKAKLLENLEIYQTGGEMVDEVDFETATFVDIPNRFEAGTQNFEAIIGFGKSIDYLQDLRQKFNQQIESYEQELLEYATNQMQKIPNLKIYGQNSNSNLSTKIPIISFLIQGIDSLDLAILLDLEGIALRSGSHCAQILLKEFTILPTCRISLTFYNTKEEIDRFIYILTQSISKLQKFS
jgi:cysteine desulfurase / selenocysteine lyase